MDSDIRDYLNNELREDSFKRQLESSIGSNLLKLVGKSSLRDLTHPDPDDVGGGGVINNECIFILSLGDIYDVERDQMPDEYDNDWFYSEEGNPIIGGHVPYSFFSKNIKYG
ncbi:MAG: hypothetical protein MJ219_03640 [Mycoplasmoidaceae bacterium]|nr:hypothetical protein [Mycoplasmoidaceae bacterium]